MTTVMEAIHKYRAGYVAPAGSYKPLDFSTATLHFEPDEDTFTPYVKAQLMQ